MKYKGPLFGKIGKSYFPLIETSEDFDKLKEKNESLLDAIEYAQNVLSTYKSNRAFKAWKKLEKAKSDVPA